MSRHYFTNGDYDVVMGSDEPLMNVFMDITKNGLSGYVYDSMLKNNDYFLEDNIQFYVDLAKREYSIDTPKEIVDQIQEEMSILKGK